MRPSPAPAAPDQRRARVHQAVRELMSEQGFRMSMDTVAARAGCSKQTLYAHFGSKQELLRSVIAEHQDLATVPLSPVVEDPREALLAFALEHLRHLNDPTIVSTSRLLAAEAHQFPDEARDLYQQACDTLVQRLATWLQHAMDQGRLRHDDPHYAAELLLSMIVGMDFERQRFGVVHRVGDRARHRWAEFSIDTFLRAFAPPTDDGAPPSVSAGRRIRSPLSSPTSPRKRNGASP
ncbi:TetR/AcrR family transcriptional regulator [Pseudoxanthomonas japonensis]|uniref:TetR/AcrR family transcriptional regulator n=1 Tax=Pseudoxanthomonas japonensis TaxID=69284 RepID=UPI001BCAD2D2|nr:TetR/AcrR family transcriptional regulator [Pseudoxanthomonas japonensis]